MTASPVYNLSPTSYTPTPPPQSSSGLVPWVVKNLRLLASSVSQLALMVPQAITKAPTTIQDGMIRLSRSPWRPVSGQTEDEWVYYDASSGGWEAFGGSSVPSTFRYVGVAFDLPYGSSDGYVAIEGLAVHATVGGSNICTGGTAYLMPAGANWGGSTPANAFTGAGWAASGISPVVLYYDLGDGHASAVAEYVITTTGWGTASQLPQVQRFVASNDGITWYEGARQFDQSWTTYPTQTFPIILH